MNEKPYGLIGGPSSDGWHPAEESERSIELPSVAQLFVGVLKFMLVHKTGMACVWVPMLMAVTALVAHFHGAEAALRYLFPQLAIMTSWNITRIFI